MTPKPVGKVASGGELSRISLAIAVTTSELGQHLRSFLTRWTPAWVEQSPKP